MLKLPHVSVFQNKVPALNCHLIGAIREPGLEETLEERTDTAESKLPPYNPLHLSQDDNSSSGLFVYFLFHVRNLVLHMAGRFGCSAQGWLC